MTAINAAMVKSLREATGAGMMECKKALLESDGDADKAREWLRIRGGAKADKVAARVAGEGRVFCVVNGNIGVLLEVTCETDFVARDENLIKFGKEIADSIVVAEPIIGGLADNSSSAKDKAGCVLQSLVLADGETAEMARRALVMKVGENVNLNRVALIRAKESFADKGGIGYYLHTGDKIGAVADISGGDGELQKDICMHIAAMRPRYIGESDVPQDIIAAEKKIIAAQVAESGKPATVAQKIVDGKLRKFLTEITLHSQPFIKDSDKTVGALLKENGATVNHFCLLAVGK